MASYQLNSQLKPYFQYDSIITLIKKTTEKLLFVGLAEFCIPHLGNNAHNSVEYRMILLPFYFQVLKTNLIKDISLYPLQLLIGQICSFILEYNNSLPRTVCTFVIYIPSLVSEKQTSYLPIAKLIYILITRYKSRTLSQALSWAPWVH